jgi:hypothetical protein
MWDDSANIYSTSEHKLCLRLGLRNTQKLKQKGPSIRKPKRAPRCTYHKEEITSQKQNREQKKTESEQNKEELYNKNCNNSATTLLECSLRENNQDRLLPFLPFVARPRGAGRG